MQESFFARSDWLGIEFADLGLPLDPGSPAPAALYDVLYAELHARHATIWEFPDLWCATKVETAAHLARTLHPTDRILSFGAGPGLVEWLLMAEHGFSHIHLWEPSAAARQILPEVRQHYLQDGLPTLGRQGPFDAIVLVQVLYALERRQATDLMAQLREHLVPGGRIVVMEGSTVPGVHGLRAPTPARRPADGRRAGHPSSPPAVVQGWGWARDTACIETILGAAGLCEVESTPGAGQWVTVATTVRQP